MTATHRRDIMNLANAIVRLLSQRLIPGRRLGASQAERFGKGVSPTNSVHLPQRATKDCSFPADPNIGLYCRGVRIESTNGLVTPTYDDQVFLDAERIAGNADGA